MRATESAHEYATRAGHVRGGRRYCQPHRLRVRFTARAMSFIVIGENVHTTRIVRRPGPLVVDESIVFTDEIGAERLLPIPEEEKRTQEYEEGRVKHVRAAVRLAMAGDETGLAYLRAIALRQIEAGAAFLDVNVDEVSHRLPEQIETMQWLVGELAPAVPVPLSIDSSNLEIIAAGIAAAGGGER